MQERNFMTLPVTFIRSSTAIKSYFYLHELPNITEKTPASVSQINPLSTEKQTKKTLLNFL